MGRAFFYSVNRVFVFCQNKEFGCDWQGIYGDCAEHLAKSCFAVRPEQLLKRLEASEKYADVLTGQLAASRVEIDHLKAENRSSELEKVEANNRAAEKLRLEAEMVVMQRELDQRASDIANLRAQGKDWGDEKTRLLQDITRLEEDNFALRGQSQVASVRLAMGASDLQKVQAKLRGRNRLVWNLEEQLRKATTKRGRDDRIRRGSPKRRRRHSSTARGSKHPPSRAVVDLEDEQERPAPWRCNDGSSPLLRWTTGQVY